MRNFVIRFGLAVLGTGLALGSKEKTSADASEILREARTLISEGDTQFVPQQGTDALRAQLAILESESKPKAALQSARAIENPFYASLALGGIAAREIPVHPSKSTAHLREALARAKEIKEYTGTHPTSLRYLFELPPFYPKKEAREAAKPMSEAVSNWPIHYWRHSKVQIHNSK